MSLPGGISTCTLTFGSDYDFAGALVSAKITVSPTHDVVWAATGQRLVSFVVTSAAATGVPGSIALPHVDQDGFTDGSGADFTMWAYSLVVTYSSSDGQKEAITKAFQPMVGQTQIDFDNIPGGSISIPVTAPIVPVTSVDGLIGEVDLADTTFGESVTSQLAALPGTYVSFGPTAPDHTTVKAWADTSTTPAVYKAWDGTAWVAASGGTTDTTARTAAATAQTGADASAKKASNLSDLASASTARTNLGLGTAAAQASTAFDTAGAATAAQAAAVAASVQKAANLSDIADTGTSRSNLHVPVLVSCQAVALANLTLSGTQTVDGVALAVGDQVLCAAQTTAANNGPWVVATGAWTRPTDFTTGVVVKGRVIHVNGGTTWAGSIWTMSTAASVTIGTTATAWAPVQAADNTIHYDRINGLWPLRNTKTTDPKRIMEWEGPTTPLIGSGYMMDDVDKYKRTRA